MPPVLELAGADVVGFRAEVPPVLELAGADVVGFRAGVPPVLKLRKLYALMQLLLGDFCLGLVWALLGLVGLSVEQFDTNLERLPVEGLAWATGPPATEAWVVVVEEERLPVEGLAWAAGPPATEA